MQNGWAFMADERQVPVPVNAADLPQTSGTTAIDYPEAMWDDPNTPITDNFYNDERYGYYYLQDKSTIKVERCVKIYDARFEVNPGATLIFNDYSQLMGREDETLAGTGTNYGRIKIRGTGGAILRNFAQHQYVQNGIIIQPDTLHYIANQAIEAGDAVDTNTDQPQGNFDVQPGADVTFEAGEVIHRTNGFQISGGSFSAYTNTNIPDVPGCYDAQRIMTNLPKGHKKTFQEGIQEFTVYPNPSSSCVFNIRFKNLPSNGELTVYNSTGVEVKRIKNIQQINMQVSVEGLAKGIYLFRYWEETDKYQNGRVVYQ